MSIAEAWARKSRLESAAALCALVEFGAAVLCNFLQIHGTLNLFADEHNGPQFIATDFKEFIRISGMTHIRTSPFYQQSKGKIERWHKSLEAECIRRAREAIPR